MEWREDRVSASKAPVKEPVKELVKELVVEGRYKAAPAAAATGAPLERKLHGFSRKLV